MGVYVILGVYVIFYISKACIHPLKIAWQSIRKQADLPVAGVKLYCRDDIAFHRVWFSIVADSTVWLFNRVEQAVGAGKRLNDVFKLK